MTTTAPPPVETTTTVRSGVELRPLERGDHATLLEIFAGLDPRSRHQRFLTPKPRLTESELRQLTAVDHHDHVALVAASSSDGRPVGIARFIRWPDRPDAADVAVEVVDAWQGRGIGRALTQALARRALEVGVRRFTLIMQSDNHAAFHLAQHSGDVHVIACYSGTVEVEVALEVG